MWKMPQWPRMLMHPKLRRRRYETQPRRLALLDLPQPRLLIRNGSLARPTSWQLKLRRAKAVDAVRSTHGEGPRITRRARLRSDPRNLWTLPMPNERVLEQLLLFCTLLFA